MEREAPPSEKIGSALDSPHAVTVVVPTYNNGTHLEQCLEGIVRQRFSQPYRCVVYDDASTDETVEVATAFTAKHPGLFQLVLQREKHIGRAALVPWMVTLLQPSSQYVAICAGSDLWLDDRKLESQWQYMERNTWCGISHHDVEIEVLDDPHDLAGELRRGLSTIRPTADRAPGADALSGNWIVTSATMIRCSSIPSNLVRIAGPRMELDYLIKALAAASGDIGYLPIPMTRYRIHSGDAWTSMTSAERHSREAEVLWFLAAHLQGAVRDVCRQRLSTIASLGWSGVQT